MKVIYIFQWIAFFSRSLSLPLFPLCPRSGKCSLLKRSCVCVPCVFVFVYARNEKNRKQTSSERYLFQFDIWVYSFSLLLLPSSFSSSSEIRRSKSTPIAISANGNSGIQLYLMEKYASSVSCSQWNLRWWLHINPNLHSMWCVATKRNLSNEWPPSEREGERKCRQIYFILFVLVFSQDKVYLWSLNRRQYGNEFNIICAATLFILSA